MRRSALTPGHLARWPAVALECVLEMRISALLTAIVVVPGVVLAASQDHSAIAGDGKRLERRAQTKMEAEQLEEVTLTTSGITIAAQVFVSNDGLSEDDALAAFDRANEYFGSFPETDRINGEFIDEIPNSQSEDKVPAKAKLHLMPIGPPKTSGKLLTNDEMREVLLKLRQKFNREVDYPIQGAEVALWRSFASKNGPEMYEILRGQLTIRKSPGFFGRVFGGCFGCTVM